MTKKVWVILLPLVILLWGCAGNGHQGQEAAESFLARNYLLDTEITISLDTSEQAETVSRRVFDRIREIEASMSAYLPRSDIARLNDGAGVSVTEIGADTYLVLKEAFTYSELTRGAFDYTVGPLVRLWGINEGNTSVPGAEEIKNALELVDFKSLQLDNSNGVYTAYLPRKGQAVDLGGIAKGYAGDEAAAVLLEGGVQGGIINLGGNIVAVGRKKDGSLWRVGVQNPLAPRGTFLGIVEVENKSVISSGAYERYFTAGGKRYHHILDPWTGYPAANGLLGVTIVAERGITADALSTGVFVLGLERGLQLVESLPGVEAVFVAEGNKVYTTRGLKDSFKLTDEEFSHEY